MSKDTQTKHSPQTYLRMTKIYANSRSTAMQRPASSKSDLKEPQLAAPLNRAGGQDDLTSDKLPQKKLLVLLDAESSLKMP